MAYYLARSSRAQLKIQEMAFVLVAFVIFFVMVGLFYISLNISGTRGDVQNQREEDAQELVRTIADSAEFRWSTTSKECKGCVDLDKVILLKDKERNFYSGLFNVDYLRVEIIYPKKIGECNRVNYPNCSSITIINKSNNYNLKGAFVSLCRRDSEIRDERCYLGKIYASAKELI